MAYYRELYKNSSFWDGKTKNCTIIVYCEQGFGDIIQFARYLPFLQDNKVILHCPQELHRLLSNFGYSFIDKTQLALPKHDFHILTMSLPTILEIPEVDNKPYIFVKEKIIENSKFKIGIAWEGNPDHSNNSMRSCPLKHFKCLIDSNTELYTISKKIHDKTLLEGCEDIELFGYEYSDFLDTAKMINSMDLIVSVDTSVLHLSGAMGKKTFGILSSHHDDRWNVANWYDSITLLKQKQLDNWEPVFEELMDHLGRKKQKTYFPKLNQNHFLFTGGIGDILSLESHMSEEETKNLEHVYYATRAKKIIDLFKIKEIFPLIKSHNVIWDDFSDFYCFHSKPECSKLLEKTPDNWGRVLDWSILTRFPEIENGTRQFKGSSFLKIKIADISHINKSRRNLCVNSYSLNDPNNPRYFSIQEWAEILHYLHKNDIQGIVLNIGDKSVPEDKHLLNLTNKTTLFEAIELLKESMGFIGVDSALSVLASQLFDEKSIVIKSRSTHLWRWKHVYYAPKTSFNFIMPKINMKNFSPNC